MRGAAIVGLIGMVIIIVWFAVSWRESPGPNMGGITGAPVATYGTTESDGWILADKNNALIALSESEQARFWKVDLSELSKAEQVFLCIWELEAEVNNGGFDQYYRNSSGDNAHSAVSALEAIGADRCASIVEEAHSLFSGGTPPRGQEKRCEILDRLADAGDERLDDLDARFFEYPDDLTELLYAYVLANKSSIAGAEKFGE